ncbi:MAG: hypothetical protein R3A11_04080 [Bdellovibrionota bacterium]
MKKNTVPMLFTLLLAMASMPLHANEDRLDAPVCIHLSDDALNELIELQIRLQELDQQYLDDNGDPEKDKEKAKEELRKELSQAQFQTVLDLLNKPEALMCVQSGDYHQTSSGWTITGPEISIKASAFLNITIKSISYNQSSNETNIMYFCTNTKTGDMKTGTLEEIVEWYEDFLNQ